MRLVFTFCLKVFSDTLLSERTDGELFVLLAVQLKANSAVRQYALNGQSMKTANVNDLRRPVLASTAIFDNLYSPAAARQIKQKY